MDILLNPGPVNISERVRKSLLRPDICHREPEFIDLQNSVRQKILDIYSLELDWAAVLMTGSGTSAVEAMLTSMVSDNDHVLILENGVYGERMTRICEIHEITHTVLHHDWECGIDLTMLEDRLKQDISHIALVHHETTTGRLNDISKISALAHQHNVSLLLDAVSSFGAEEIRFADWNISACAATANKCLHGVPGISFAIVNREAIQQANKTNTLYLDLKTYLHQQDQGGTPFTQSIQVLYALDEALEEHSESGGWQSRRDDYRQKMQLLNSRLASLNFIPLIDPNETSCVLVTYLLPIKTDYQEFHDFLKENGFVIYSGQGELATKVFRLSLMGAVSNADIERLIDRIVEFINK